MGAQLAPRPRWQPTRALAVELSNYAPRMVRGCYLSTWPSLGVNSSWSSICSASNRSYSIWPWCHTNYTNVSNLPFLTDRFRSSRWSTRFSLHKLTTLLLARHKHAASGRCNPSRLAIFRSRRSSRKSSSSWTPTVQTISKTMTLAPWRTVTWSTMRAPY